MIGFLASPPRETPRSTLAVRYASKTGCSLASAALRYGVSVGRVREVWARRGVPSPRRAEKMAIVESLNSALTSRSRTAAELFARVRTEWGTVGERRLWRYLKALVDSGHAVRVGPWSRIGTGYVRGAP